MSEIISTRRSAAAGRRSGSAQGKRVAGPAPVKPDVRALRAAATRRPSCCWTASSARATRSRSSSSRGTRSSTAIASTGKQIELTTCEPPTAEQIIIGARPCDAAALPILDHVFNWDYKDEFYNRRRAADHRRHAGLPRARRRTASAPRSGSGPAADARLRRDAVRPGRRRVRGPLPDREGQGAVRGQDRAVRQDGPGRRRARRRSSTWRPSAHSSPAASRTRVWQADRRCAAWAAAPAPTPARRATASTSSTKATRPAARGSRTGTPASSACSPARLGPQPAQRPGPAAAAAHLPQVPDLSRQVRRDSLHRLRQLHAQLPGGAGRAAGSRDDRDALRSQAGSRRDDGEHLQTRPDGSRPGPPADGRREVGAHAVSRPRAGQGLLLPRRPVRHLLGLRRRRVDLQHLLQLRTGRTTSSSASARPAA